MSDPRPTGERTLPGIPEENYWFRRHEFAYRLARGRAGTRVLDAGCGEGYGTRMLGHGRRAAIGLDLDARTVALAAARYSGRRFAVADLCRMPIRPAWADTVVALQVLEHLWCPDAFLAACRDALRPGGTLILSTPNRKTFPAGRNPSHVHEFDRDELADLLGRHFDDVELAGTGHRGWLALLDRVLGEPVQHRLVARPYPEQPRWLRATLRRVRRWDFRITRDADAGLDLIAVCRTIVP